MPELDNLKMGINVLSVVISPCYFLIQGRRGFLFNKEKMQEKLDR